jgi:group I intron endonuclease
MIQQCLSLDKVSPVAVYNNADLQKDLAIKENKGIAGVYRWVNKESGKSYVGSSVDLSKRFRKYYSYNHIADTMRNMAIDRALLKYGYSSFQLEILEYCDSTGVSLLEREQFYLDLLKPEYNILSKAGSSLGYKHTEETLEKFRARKLTPEQKAKLLGHLSKLNASGLTSERRATLSARMVAFNVSAKGKKLVFTNIETQEITTFLSMRDAASEMKISRNTIVKYLKSKELFGKYKITLGN